MDKKGENKEYESINELITAVLNDYSSWETEAFPWFRGEPGASEAVFDPLLPKLYRPVDGKKYLENRLLQQFRLKAPGLGLGETPPMERTDQWLFLAQHVGLPTRLLDWTEGLLLALHFALDFDQPIIWMLDPYELNRLSLVPGEEPNVFSLTWLDYPGAVASKKDIYRSLQPELHLGHWRGLEEMMTHPNPANINIRAAWEDARDTMGTIYPYAILPTYVHSRMSAQKSCFTIWGTDQRPLVSMEKINERILRRYVIAQKSTKRMRTELRLLGVTHISLFSDLDRLAKDLKDVWLE